MADKRRYTSGADANVGELPCTDDNTINTNSFEQFKVLLKKSIDAGTTFSNPIISTYSLVYTVLNAYSGGVLAPNGDIHFVPRSTAVGQKISAAGVVSTYSLVYTVATAYYGGVLAPNGDIHFVPTKAAVGQKVSILPAKPWSLAICLHSFFNKL